MCQDLPNLLKGTAVAKKAWLLPLADLDTRCQRFAREADSLFSKLLFQKIQDLFEYLNEVEVSTNDLLQNEASLCFTGINRELNCLKRLVNAYALNVKGDIAILLPQIRAGKVPTVKLEDVIKQNSRSLFSQECLSSLICEKEREIRYLSQYLMFLKQQQLVHFAFKDGELDSVFDFNDARDVVCLDFNIHWGNNNVMNRMEAYLQDEKRDKKTPNSTYEFWCTESAVAIIKQQIQLFAGHVEANRCRPGMKYVVTNGQSKLAKQAPDKVAVISLYQGSSSPIEFQPLGPPGKPHAETVTSDSVSLTWQAPKRGSKNITGYNVSYSYEENKWFDVKVILDRYDLQNPVIVATNLIPNTTYRFKVQANNANGNGPYSLTSESITTKPPVALKEKYRPHCKLVNEKIPKVYKLPTHATFQSDLIEKRDALAPRSSVSTAAPQKVVMLVGATGSGKTTLINAMANYILGVNWDDDYRFKLITENTSDDQTKSQTKVITAYTFHKEEGYPFHYSLTVIDTPGFGDTEGLERDKRITAQIKEFFCSENGIDQLHAVGFVVQSSQARLTPTQKYVFSAILSIFGKDIAENIFLMTTFGDGNEPQVLDAIKKAKVPFERYFEFNNSALFVDKTKRVIFNSGFWHMGKESFQCFFDALLSLEVRSLQLTQEVLTERQHLEVCLEGLRPQIRNGLNERSKLEKTRLQLEQREADMRANEDFTITVKVTKQRSIPLEGGLFTTTCLKCNYTCHLHCTISNDEKKYKCASMTWLARKEKTTCKVCPQKCYWSFHKNTPYQYEFYETEETQTLKEISDRYEVAESSKNKLENLIVQINKRISKIDRGIEQNLQEARNSLCRLQEIALMPNPMTHEEYIDILIETEKRECKLGWEDRVKGLEVAKEINASLITTVQKGDVASLYTEAAKPMGDPRGRGWLNVGAHSALHWFGKQVDRIV